MFRSYDYNSEKGGHDQADQMIWILLCQRKFNRWLLSGFVWKNDEKKQQIQNQMEEFIDEGPPAVQDAPIEEVAEAETNDITAAMNENFEEAPVQQNVSLKFVLDCRI